MLAIFVFYNKSGVWRSCISPKEFKHVELFVYSGDRWMLLGYDDDGLHYRIFKNINAQRLIAALIKMPTVTRVVSIDIGERKKYRWWPWTINTCNHMVQRWLGLDLPWSVTPKGLYDKLFWFNKRRNFEIIYSWSR